MGLLTLTTNLKSLKYGSDRRGGGIGSSGQPYIQTPIPNEPPGTGKDFLWRYGAPGRATIDAFVGNEGGLAGFGGPGRLTKWVFDLKSPSGLLFTIKQNALSRIGVRTQASGKLVRDGVYNPLDTLLQAQVGFTGIHNTKQVRLNTYSDLLSSQIELDEDAEINLENAGKTATSTSIIDPVNNRLILLQQTKISNLLTKDIKEIGGLDFKLAKFAKKTGISFNDTELLAYGGGPGSNAGFGKTRIKFAQTNRGGILKTGDVKYQIGFGANPKTSYFYTWTSKQLGSIGYENLTNSPLPNWIPNTGLSSLPQVQAIFDFREPLRKEIKEENGRPKVSTIMSIAPDYTNKEKTYEGDKSSRVHIISPGQKGNIYNYSKNKLDGQDKPIGAVDQINALPIYESDRVAEKSVNDLVQFRVAAISNELNSNKKQYIHFRAFLNNFGDSYNASWEEMKYMGRGESFYKYGGFGREISLGFTMAAQSRQELIPMYKKLNFLASNLAPIYSDAGYMAGPLVELTVGGWCYELPGFIQNLSYEVSEESTWEIGIDGEGGTDNEVRELPHIVNVSGFTFIPIHKFVPQKQKLNTVQDKQHYIALENASGNLY